MRRTDAVCAQYRRPDGVAFSLQVCRNSIEPAPSNRGFNLFANDDVRMALADEPDPFRPKVTAVRMCRLSTGGAEGLTGTASGPDGEGIVPSGEPESVGPAADPGKEVALVETAEVSWLNNGNGAVIDFAIGNQPFLNERTEPRDTERINLVIVGTHGYQPRPRNHCSHSSHAVMR